MDVPTGESQLTETDDDYIPFEGPIRDARGPKKMSPEDAEKLLELVRKLKLNQGRMRRPSLGTGQ
jgi:hypothetical protein